MGSTANIREEERKEVMSGFKKYNNPRVNINEVAKLTKKYKNLKKYMRSPLYDIKMMDGTETAITNLLKELDSDEKLD